MKVCVMVESPGPIMEVHFWSKVLLISWLLYDFAITKSVFSVNREIPQPFVCQMKQLLN